MTIHKTNNQSFKAIYFEYNGNETKVQKNNKNKILKTPGLSKTQKNTIKSILKNPDLTPKLVKDLEQMDTDIYISAKPYSDEVSLKLYSDINWFGNKIIPCDGRYSAKMETSINPELRGQLWSDLAVSNFFKRANDMDFGSDCNLKILSKAVYGLPNADTK